MLARLPSSFAMATVTHAHSFLKVANVFNCNCDISKVFPLTSIPKKIFSGIAKRIADAGYAVFAMDYPGFGLSQGLHGYIPSFDGLVDQVIEQYAIIRGRYSR